MATETKAVANEIKHVCDVCKEAFECKTHRIGELGVSCCDCLQSVVKLINDEKDGVVDGPNSLIFFCGDWCWDEEYPEESSDEECEATAYGEECLDCGEVHE